MFPDEIRERVRRALEADAGYAAWSKQQEEAVTDARAREERVRRIREEMRAGRRPRLSLPELDQGL